MQCEPSTSFHWEDCACNQACRTRSCTRACTMARPHCTKCWPKSRAECLQGNWKHRGRKESCWWRCQSRGTSVWSRGQIKGWSKGSRPQITSAKGCANKCPKLLKLIIICCSRPCKGQTCTKADANVGKIISAFSHRQTTTSTSVQEETHWLIWHIFFRTGNAQRAPGTDDAWALCGVLHLHWWTSQRLTGERTLSEG